jgi:hypothetical protein
LGCHGCNRKRGSLGDSTPISPSAELKLANTWLTADRIVIGHANEPTVTLKDAFG